MVQVKTILGDMEGETVPLRSAAPHWSLEGDSQLLNVLQNLHQTIITKCQDTTTQLDAMVSALDNASIDLQNVNNKFMALSNSQFVESRVYEDEVELTDSNTKQESPKPEAQISLSSLKLGLQVLESLHEVVAIVDSDSDEEHSPRRVLRPRARGRLPHVVGSQAWRDAAHAGLSSDADSDDSTDKRASAREEYSDSDSDHHTVSPSSLSSMTSHAPPPPVTSHAPPPPVTSHAPPPPVTSHAPPPPVTSHTPSPHHAHTEEQIGEPELDESPQPRKFYTVVKPIPAQIFPDEPPPLDSFEADSDDDIFAELHKQSYPHSNKSQNVADDLFGSGPYVKRNKDDYDIGSIVTNTLATEDASLFPRPVETESKETPTRETYPEAVVKKPVGGISLFGSTGSESIGAAILKRNQRQSSSESDGTKTKKTNIIEDLFTKPSKNEPSNAKNKPVVKEVFKEKTLFSDNIFDDIDDIFTSNVIAKTKDNKDKINIYDDDLFKTDKNDNNDLFNDKIKDSDYDKNEPLYESSKETKDRVKNIFDSDSEDDLFSDVKLKENNLKTNANDKNLLNEDVSDAHREIKSELKDNKTEIKVDQLKYQSSPNIFDDDIEDVLFGDKTQSKEVSHSKSEIETYMSDGIQSGDDEPYNIRSEITRNNEVKITEPETKIFPLENEGIKEKYFGDTERVHNNVSDNDGKNVIIIINESELDKEDIKKLSTVVQNNGSETVVSNPKNASLREIDFLETAKPPKEEIITKKIIEENHSKDIFVDIFGNLPPAFEKPVEPKKSKNVNALFDDDSDDEALFFKKDDVITDEKPDLEFKSDRFQIFHDEPPDINIDFSQKSRNTSQISAEMNLPDQENLVNVTKILGNSTKEEDLVIKTEKSTEKETLTVDLHSENKPDVDHVNSNIITNNEKKSKTDIMKLLQSERDEEIFKVNRNIDEHIFSDSDKNDSNEKTSKSDIKVNINKDDTDSSESEKKPVGRLRPVSININVSSLLPGAVPTKTKNDEETDGQTASKSYEKYSPDVTEPQMVKSVSFKGNLDSEVLDNKLSKERAKIQVKRRPSTRRARLEAVRKSGLDFGSDSTDNSSSFDEPVKEKHQNDKISVPYKKLKNETKLKTNNEIKEVKSKVVYVLNDEDIFEVQGARAGGVQTNIAGLINSESTKENAKENLTHYTTDNKPPLEDAVSQKQMIEVDKTKKSLFDDMSDDDTELFKKPVQKSLFDSDSESELFSGKKDNGTRESVSKLEQKKIKETKVHQKVKESKVAKKVTKALFSEDSDEDLFGGKTKKSDFKETSKLKPSATKTSQSFEDPLSAPRDDDI